MLPFVFLVAALAFPPPADDDDGPKLGSSKPPAASVARDADDKPDKSDAPAGGQPVDADDDDEGRAQLNGTIVVTARKLDAARTKIDTALGATVYSLTNEAIENRPGGETGSISQILTQAPGATVTGATLSIRGSSANQVRINDVIVPEAISDPADHLSSRLAETTRLITGTLPAQFGFAPAGVISVTTKNGLYQHGGQAEFFAGSNGMVEPAIEWAGSAVGTSLFGSASFEHDRSTVADAQGLSAADGRNELEGLVFADHVIDEENRLSIVAGGSGEKHRFEATAIGPGSERSGDGYLVGTFQHSDHRLSVQASLFGGVASDQSVFVERTGDRRSTFGSQIDTSTKLGSANTLRVGLLASRSLVHELDPAGDRTSKDRTAIAFYAQDEWTILRSLTLNPGARIEWLRGFGSSAEIEPRASLVWQSRSGLTAHAGYARYASAPALGDRVDRTAVPDEGDDYLDAGIQQLLGALAIGLDGYWRKAHNYLTQHETPGQAPSNAFAFKHARIGGVELSATYASGPLTGWASLSLSNARARTIVGGEGIFTPTVLEAASKDWVALASDRPVTASGGLTWRTGKLSLSGDALASSGAVRTIASTEPNGSRHPAYAIFGLAAVYHARFAGQPTDLRLDLTNLTNARYATSDAANLEGGWTRQGRRRSIAVGIEQGF